MSAQLILPTPSLPYIGPSEVPLNPPAGLPRALLGWVAEVANLTRPDSIRWWGGTRAERDQVQAHLRRDPDSPAADAAPRSTADRAPAPRADRPGGSRIFSCTADPAQAEPADLWAEPDTMRRTLLKLFAGCMRGRRMYVVPYAVPTPPAEAAHLGVELTDSPFVVLGLAAIARTGRSPLSRIRAGGHWVPSVHSVGYPLVDADGTPRPDVAWPCSHEKWIAEFPESEDVWSYGTGFGAVALVG